MRRLVTLALLLGLAGAFGCCHDTCDCCDFHPCGMTTGGCANCGQPVNGYINPVPAGAAAPVQQMPPPSTKTPAMPTPIK